MQDGAPSLNQLVALPRSSRQLQTAERLTRSARDTGASSVAQFVRLQFLRRNYSMYNVMFAFSGPLYRTVPPVATDPGPKP